MFLGAEAPAVVWVVAEVLPQNRARARGAKKPASALTGFFA